MFCLDSDAFCLLEVLGVVIVAVDAPEMIVLSCVACDVLLCRSEII